VQKPCLRCVGVESAGVEVARLWASCSAGIRAYLTTEKQSPATAFAIRDTNPQDSIPKTVQAAFQMVYYTQEDAATAP